MELKHAVDLVPTLHPNLEVSIAKEMLLMLGHALNVIAPSIASGCPSLIGRLAASHVTLELGNV